MFHCLKIDVSDSPVQLSAANGSSDLVAGQSLGIIGCDVDLYLGGDDTVTAAGAGRGAKLPANTPFTVDLAGRDHVWAVCATGVTGTAEVTRAGV